MNLDDQLRSMLSGAGYDLAKPTEETVPTEAEVTSQQYREDNSALQPHILLVMSAYQNANRYLDIIKEELLINKGVVFFSNYIHDLAHTMPIRFDAFGDILHTQNILVPYPPTPEMPYVLSSMEEVFSAIFDILDKIGDSLRGFIKATQDTKYHSMACKTEELLIGIDSEYESLFRMMRVYNTCQDLVKFDKWVRQYLTGK